MRIKSKDKKILEEYIGKDNVPKVLNDLVDIVDTSLEVGLPFETLEMYYNRSKTKDLYNKSTYYNYCLDTYNILEHRKDYTSQPKRESLFQTYVKMNVDIAKKEQK